MADRKRLCLIDLSAIFRRHWHASEHDGISAAYNKTLSSVHELSAGYDHVAVCVDRPPYNRKKDFPEYKAQREAAPEQMYEQARAVEDALDADGFHIVGSKGFEADDIIATLARHHVREMDVIIHSPDKDLLQLVDDGVRVISTATGKAYDRAAVREKFGLEPEQIADMLALIGDASDNIPGVRGVGPKTAAKWLAEFGNLYDLLTATDSLPERFRGPVKAQSQQLVANMGLVTLHEAPINCDEILKPKERRERPQQEEIDMSEDTETEAEIIDAPAAEPRAVTAVAVRQETVPWERALEPRDSKQAWGLCQYLYKSRVFGEFSTPEAVLAVVMTGRSMGLDAVASLRGFHVVKGKVAPSAQVLLGLVKRHPACDWFRFVKGDAQSATFETKRKDEPEATTLTYTIEQARAAGLASNDNWKKRPETMLRWRCASELARLVYPDVTASLYTREELEDGGGE